jgi:hypothetical protein
MAENTKKTNEVISVTDYGAKCDGVTDDTVAIQAAINYCIANNRDLSIPALSKITASLNIDRLVDGAAFDSYFTIYSESGGGIYVDSSIPIFSSTIPFTDNPVSQLIRWENLRFVASNNSLNAYVLDNSRFLRSEFKGCSFSKIKCLLSTRYVQSIYFTDCNARRWTGAFFKATRGYDIQVIGGLYEAGGGDCFDINNPTGCKFYTTIEGMSGTALKINGAQGVDISCYFEENGMDIDCRTEGLPNYGINLHGSFMSHAATHYTVKWGNCKGCVSIGNFHTTNFHDLQSDSDVYINDVSLGSLANNEYVITHTGYLEGQAPALSIRGGNSASYSVSNFTSTISKMGNRVNIDFICTLTSTGTNGIDVLYIPSEFLDSAKTQNAMCGYVEVVGSSQNNGISPLYITSTDPMRVMSSQVVIPANTSGQSWTVRGQLSYLTI